MVVVVGEEGVLVGDVGGGGRRRRRVGAPKRVEIAGESGRRER